jgi:hypothetical protein
MSLLSYVLRQVFYGKRRLCARMSVGQRIFIECRIYHMEFQVWIPGLGGNDDLSGDGIS